MIGLRRVVVGVVMLGTIGALAFSASPTFANTADAVSAGALHTCALTTADGVMCWGNNVGGQLGDGTTANSASPVQVAGMTGGVDSIAAGGSWSCALLTVGTAQCWGNNSSGALGSGASGGNQVTPGDVCESGGPGPGCVPLPGIVSITAGNGHACAIMTTSGVKCWGQNDSGQLGDGTSGLFNRSLTPVDVCADATCTGDLTGAVGITAGRDHTCALTAAGGVKCWGVNLHGQLGDGTRGGGNLSATPVDVVGLTSGVAYVDAGQTHTCAVTVAGTIKCWGFNAVGQLGNGTTGDPCCGNNPLPVDVAGLGSGAVSVTGGELHTCALTSAGAAKCWGWNEDGQLGDGGSPTNSTTPVDVVGMNGGVASVEAGYRHTCAVKSGGSIACWGRNIDGRLGDGSLTDRSSPVDVIGFEPNTPTGTDVAVALNGGLAEAGGVEIAFSDVTTSGNTTVATSSGGPPPPTGLKIVGTGGQPLYYDFNTTATFLGTVTVCIRYDETQVSGPESQLKLMHDDGSGFANITTSIDEVNNIICGTTTTLSPFAVMEDAPPSVGGIEVPFDDSDLAAGQSASSSGSSGLPYAALAGAVAAALALVTAGGWYARRRRLR